MHAVVELETQTMPVGVVEAQSQDTRTHVLIAGAALLVVGLDFTGLTNEQHDALNSRTMVDMMVYENYHRLLRVSGFIGDLFSGLRHDWGVVKEIKSPMLKGPLGNVLHYITHLDSETRLLKQQKDSLPKSSERVRLCTEAEVHINHKN